MFFILIFPLKLVCIFIFWQQFKLNSNSVGWLWDMPLSLRIVEELGMSSHHSLSLNSCLAIACQWTGLNRRKKQKISVRWWVFIPFTKISLNADPKTWVLLNFICYSSVAACLQFYFCAFWFSQSTDVLVPDISNPGFGQWKAKLKFSFLGTQQT